MYQNLINSLKKILDSKATQAEKLLKISTLVDFADGLEQPVPTPQPRPIPFQQEPFLKGAPTPTAQPTNTIDAKHPTGPGALVGVEDVK